MAEATSEVVGIAVVAIAAAVTAAVEDTVAEAMVAAAGRLRIIPIPDSRPGFFYITRSLRPLPVHLLAFRFFR